LKNTIIPPKKCVATRTVSPPRWIKIHEVEFELNQKLRPELVIITRIIQTAGRYKI